MLKMNNWEGQEDGAWLMNWGRQEDAICSESFIMMFHLEPKLIEYCIQKHTDTILSANENPEVRLRRGHVK